MPTYHVNPRLPSNGLVGVDIVAEVWTSGTLIAGVCSGCELDANPHVHVPVSGEPHKIAPLADGDIVAALPTGYHVFPPELFNRLFVTD